MNDRREQRYKMRGMNIILKNGRRTEMPNISGE
jgi:hypothetical protein